MIGPRPEVLEEICCSLPCRTIRTIKFMPVRGVGDAAPTTNLLVRYTFLMKNRIRPRRGRVTPPYREFTGLQRDLKRFVGNGLDRSGCFPYFPFVWNIVHGFRNGQDRSLQSKNTWKATHDNRQQPTKIGPLPVVFIIIYYKVSSVLSFQRRNKNSRKTLTHPAAGQRHRAGW